jgi:predicted enzyme related to lactoylglutathione lyase
MTRSASVSVFLLLGIGLAACRSLPEVPPLAQPATNNHLPGQFVWYDLVTLDPDESQDFYGALFGWEFEPSNKEDLYTIVKHDGTPIAGMINLRNTRRDRKAHPQWLSYVSVEDVDAATEMATGLGAILDVDPFDLTQRGRIATLLDNRGALIVLVHSSTGDPPRAEPIWNRWLWTELWTDDTSASSSFYKALTGYEVDSLKLADLGEYTLFVKGDRRLSGMVSIPDDRITPNWLPYIAVEDPAAVEAKAEELGGRVLASARQSSDGRAAILTDPTGAAFGIHRWPIDLRTYPRADDE